MQAENETLTVASRRKWRTWLAQHHRSKNVIWLVYHKKGRTQDWTSYKKFLADTVEEAICHGWIDSRVKRLDIARLAIRFTPWRSSLNWSKYNAARAIRLLREGRVAKAGLAVMPSAWHGHKRNNCARSRTRKHSNEPL
ncbi:MAG TPA: hypothetical protein VFE98_08020 [Candidatus Bathyarchaeia archaeon]|nr:hypothetical protein [Candidatus Bathyarchaeia archaeon]